METRNLLDEVIASYTYTLNSKGRRTHVEEGFGGAVLRTIDYVYDDADRLTEEQIADTVLGNHTITYTYDNVGNRLEKNDNGVITTYAYDNNDRLTSSAEEGVTTTYTYDDNGNMLTKSGNGETWQLTYNALNQVTGADITTPSGATNVEYVYDHDGIRVGKTMDGTDVTRYVVDKNRPYAQVLEEQRTSGTVTSYVYGDTLLSQATGGMAHYYLYDGMHSVRGLADSAGTLTDAYTYDAYGNLLDNSGPTINPYRYRGEQFDEDLDAYYLRARYYQPGVGRFLTTDPVEGMMGDPLSAHRYLYGYDEPTNNLDPSGKSNLTEKLVVAGILLDLVGVGFEIAAGLYEDFGDRLAEWLPDAALIGISGSITPKAMKVLRGIVGLDGEYISGGGVLGADFIFSIASAQYGLYFYGGFQGELGNFRGLQAPLNLGFSLYHGWIWNLWNTNNYTGPFVSYNVGLWGSHGGINFFKDATSYTFEGGPFGVSFTAFSWQSAGNTQSVGLAYTWYPHDKQLWKLKTYYSWREDAGMYAVARKLMVCQLAMVAISFKSTNSVGIVSSIGGHSWPMTIAVSKEIWNKKRHNDIDSSVDQRQKIDRPDGF